MELEVPAKVEFIGIVRLLVSTLAVSRRLLSDERVDDLKLAVSEAATNAVESYGESTENALVSVRWSEEDDKVVVGISDRGRGFDLVKLHTKLGLVDAERLNFERGLGVPLIRSLVDEALFESSPAGTTVRMVMFCDPRVEEPERLDAI